MDEQLLARDRARVDADPTPRLVETASARRVEVLDVAIDHLTMQQTVDRCVEAAENGGYLGQISVNAVQLMAIRRDSFLSAVTSRRDIVVSADGLPVVWLSRLLGDPLPERVPGIDLMTGLLRVAADRGFSVYFLGARPAVVEALVDGLKRRLPALRVAGYRDGYVDDQQASQVIDEIERAQPDLLFVGTGSPAQEHWVERVRATGVGVALAVGGSFDVLSGAKRRAPAAWQRLGLEWLYRLFQDPRRYASRYAHAYPGFVGLAVKAVVLRLLRPARAFEREDAA